MLAFQYSHLPNQDYRICIRQEAGHCGLRWTASNEPNSFTLSSSSSPTPGTSNTGEGGCGKDYVVIPGGNGNNQFGCAVTGTAYVTDSIGEYVHLFVWRGCISHIGTGRQGKRAK